MSFCPSCGEVIQPTALVCYNCNNTLDNKNSLRGDFNDLIEQSKTYSLGVNLENFLEDTILRTGYVNTEKRKKIIGISGTHHEIDVLAYNGKNIVAFECKNYTNPVSIKEIRDFKSKLDDLPHISEGVFATNSRFTPEATTFANHYNIRLWDGENLSKIHYLSTIGRLNNNQNIGGTQQDSHIEGQESYDEISIKNSIPVVTEYNSIKKIKLVNPQHAIISKSELIFIPFYIIKFSIKEEKKRWLGRKGTLADEETYIINAIDGKVLYESDLDQNMNRFLFSKELAKKGNHPDEVSDEVRKYEENLIIRTITDSPKIKNYKIKKNIYYSIVVHDSVYPIEAAERTIVEQIVDSRNISYDSVTVLDYDEVYVPKWSLVIETLGLIYKRESIASANVYLRDEIDLCPKDNEKETRKTFAVCESCGAAVCSKHIIHKDFKYYCIDHKISSESLISKKLRRLDINELKEISENVNTLLSSRVFHRKNKRQKDIDESEKIKLEFKDGDTANKDKDDDTASVGRPIKW